MLCEFNVKDNKVLFSNGAVRNLELFELEFITDAPKLCRLLRKKAKSIEDPWGIVSTATKEKIKCYVDTLEAPSDFVIRFINPYEREFDVEIRVTVKEW